MKYILDTCAILWSISDPEKLTDIAKQAITAAESEIMLVAISCAEIACAVERKRIVLNQHWKIWFRTYIEKNEWEVLSMDLSMVEEAYSLPTPFHRDPADRLIVAASRNLKAPIITADKKMIEYPHVETLW